MLNGYLISVRDYKAEIIEFATLSIVNMPDGSKLHLIHTKYGDDYHAESELHETREELEKECAELNESLSKAQNRGQKWIYHKQK